MTHPQMCTVCAGNATRPTKATIARYTLSPNEVAMLRHAAFGPTQITGRYWPRGVALSLERKGLGTIHETTMAAGSRGRVFMLNGIGRRLAGLPGEVILNKRNGRTWYSTRQVRDEHRAQQARKRVLIAAKRTRSGLSWVNELECSLADWRWGNVLAADARRFVRAVRALQRAETKLKQAPKRARRSK